MGKPLKELPWNQQYVGSCKQLFAASHYPSTPSRKFQGKIGHYDSFSEPNVWHGFKWSFAVPQIYLQPAKIKRQHFGVSLKFLVCNWKYCI